MILDPLAYAGYVDVRSRLLLAGHACGEMASVAAGVADQSSEHTGVAVRATALAIHRQLGLTTVCCTHLHHLLEE